MFWPNTWTHRCHTATDVSTKHRNTHMSTATDVSIKHLHRHYIDILAKHLSTSCHIANVSSKRRLRKYWFFFLNTDKKSPIKTSCPAIIVHIYTTEYVKMYTQNKHNCYFWIHNSYDYTTYCNDSIYLSTYCLCCSKKHSRYSDTYTAVYGISKRTLHK